MEKSDSGIAKWEQIKKGEIDSAVEQFRALVELVSVPGVRVGECGTVDSKAGTKILQDFVVKRNSVIYGFDTVEEYKKAVKKMVSERVYKSPGGMVKK